MQYRYAKFIATRYLQSAGERNVSFHTELGRMIFAGFYTFVFLTPLIAWRLKSFIKPYFKITIICTCLAMLLALLAETLGVSFLSTTVNAFFIYALYLFVGVCAFQFYSKSQKRLIKSLSVIARIPFFIIPILSVPAILAVAFIVSDFEVEYETTSPEGYLCSITSYGNATTSVNGYEANIYRKLLIFKVEKDNMRIENTYKPEITPEYTCRIALNKFKS